MSDTPNMSQMQHQWSYVVIPIGPEQIPLFSAYCRICKSYYTKTLIYNDEITGYLDQTHLPEWGCIKPMGV